MKRLLIASFLLVFPLLSISCSIGRNKSSFPLDASLTTTREFSDVGGLRLIFEIDSDLNINKIQPSELKKAVKNVQNQLTARAKFLGIPNARVEIFDRNKFVVNLPLIEEPRSVDEARIINLLSSTGLLDIRIMKSGANKKLLDALLSFKRQNPLRGTYDERILEFFEKPEQDNWQVRSVKVVEDGNGFWYVSGSLDTNFAQEFAKLTKSIAGSNQLLGIFLDGESISAASVGPQYQAAGITGGSFRINVSSKEEGIRIADKMILKPIALPLILSSKKYVAPALLPRS